MKTKIVAGVMLVFLAVASAAFASTDIFDYLRESYDTFRSDASFLVSLSGYGTNFSATNGNITEQIVEHKVHYRYYLESTIEKILKGLKPDDPLEYKKIENFLVHIKGILLQEHALYLNDIAVWVGNEENRKKYPGRSELDLANIAAITLQSGYRTRVYERLDAWMKNYDTEAGLGESNHICFTVFCKMVLDGIMVYDPLYRSILANKPATSPMAGLATAATTPTVETQTPLQQSAQGIVDGATTIQADPQAVLPGVEPIHRDPIDGGIGIEGRIQGDPTPSIDLPLLPDEIIELYAHIEGIQKNCLDPNGSGQISTPDIGWMKAAYDLYMKYKDYLNLNPDVIRTLDINQDGIVDDTDCDIAVQLIRSFAGQDPNEAYATYIAMKAVGFVPGQEGPLYKAIEVSQSNGNWVIVIAKSAGDETTLYKVTVSGDFQVIKEPENLTELFERFIVGIQKNCLDPNGSGQISTPDIGWMKATYDLYMKYKDYLNLNPDVIRTLDINQDGIVDDTDCDIAVQLIRSFAGQDPNEAYATYIAMKAVGFVPGQEGPLYKAIEVSQSNGNWVIVIAKTAGTDTTLYKVTISGDFQVIKDPENLTELFERFIVGIQKNCLDPNGSGQISTPDIGWMKAAYDLYMKYKDYLNAGTDVIRLLDINQDGVIDDNDFYAAAQLIRSFNGKDPNKSYATYLAMKKVGFVPGQEGPLYDVLKVATTYDENGNEQWQVTIKVSTGADVGSMVYIVTVLSDFTVSPIIGIIQGEKLIPVFEPPEKVTVHVGSFNVKGIDFSLVQAQLAAAQAQKQEVSAQIAVQAQVQQPGSGTVPTIASAQHTTMHDIIQIHD